STFLRSPPAHPRHLHSFPTRRSSDLVRRWLFGKTGIQSGQPALPEPEFGTQPRIGGDTAGHALVLGGIQQAERKLADEETVLAARAVAAIVWRAHAVRHSLSRNRLRRSQVRIVFSGTLWRTASSS